MTRFIYPLVPIALLYIFAVVPTIARIVEQSPGLTAWANAGLAALLLLMIVPNAAAVASRFSAPVPEPIPEDSRHTRNWLEGGGTKSIREGSDEKKQRDLIEQAHQPGPGAERVRLRGPPALGDALY